MAQPMHYESPDLFSNIKAATIAFRPDAIIGSSMGGWFAWLIGSQLNIPRILLNPALHGRSFEPRVDLRLNHEPQTHVLLGRHDTLIDPQITVKILAQSKAVITYGEHAHRTPLEVFQSYMRGLSDKITN